MAEDRARSMPSMMSMAWLPNSRVHQAFAFNAMCDDGSSGHGAAAGVSFRPARSKAGGYRPPVGTLDAHEKSRPWDTFPGGGKGLGRSGSLVLSAAGLPGALRGGAGRTSS
jgi:hypothetical protein